MGNDKKTFFAQAYEDMKEDAIGQHKIDKENFAALKADAKSRLEQAATPTPDFKEFKSAKGFSAKVGVVAGHARRDAKEMKEQNRDDMKKMLKKQRENINELTEKYARV